MSDLTYAEGDRCAVCGYWFWDRPAEDVGWHSLVPITYADTPELRRIVFCPLHMPRRKPTGADIARGQELAKEHGW